MKTGRSTETLPGKFIVEIMDKEGTGVQIIERELDVSESQVETEFALKAGEKYTVKVVAKEGISLILKQMDYYRK